MRTFHSGLENDMTPYSGEPSPKVDEAWSGLYPSTSMIG